MAEELIIGKGSKDDKYKTLYEQVAALTAVETDVIANMANVSAMIHETFGFLWTGFYRVVNDQLVLGPFQGPLACSRIRFGKGVCGTAWKERRTLVVADVQQFQGHIACSSLSKSEVVVPVCRNGDIVAVLDIDSAGLAAFDDTDARWLRRIAALLFPND